jgi:hypothetical protein
MCSRDDDPSTYDAVRREQIRRAAVTRDGTQLDTSPGFRKPGEIVNGIYTVVASLPAPGSNNAVYPSFLLVAGHLMLHQFGRPAEADIPSTWLGWGWLRFSLWTRDPHADTTDAEFELTPLLNRAVHRWAVCPICYVNNPSAGDLLDHLHGVHAYSLLMLESQLRLSGEARITLPQKGDAVDADDNRID